MKEILCIAKTECVRWVRNSRIILFFMMLLFIQNLIVQPLLQCSTVMQEKLSCFESFLALGNSGTVVLIVPLFFLVMMSDYPERSSFDLFYQIRCSKRTWFWGQVLFGAAAALGTVLLLLLGSVLLSLPRSTWMLHYSRAVTRYSVRFPERSGDYVLSLIPANLYNQISLTKGLLHTSCLLFLYLFSLALILLLASICQRKTIGVAGDAVLILIGTISCAINASWRWIFPMAHTIVWYHWKEYLSEAVCSLGKSYLYFGGLCVALLLCGYHSITKYQIGIQA